VATAIGTSAGAWLAFTFWKRRRDAGTEEDDPGAVGAELISRAVNQHRAIRDAINDIPDVAVRVSLEDRLAAIKAEYLSQELTEHVAAERWPVATALVRAALAALDRLQTVVDQRRARHDTSIFSGDARNAAAPPKSPAEAYELLGVNPDASRTVVKKVVDGLRQSWHPDHAKDEPDRQRREERIKQINIAWDLIEAETKERAA
jgi:hypothetical protein